MADIFISYSKSNHKVAVDLANYLESKGYSVWWDTSLIIGERFRDVINQELDACQAVIVIWTQHSVDSDWVIAEADHAHRQKKLIPIRAADIELHAIPKPFGNYHTDLANNYDAINRTLVQLKVMPFTEEGSHNTYGKGCGNNFKFINSELSLDNLEDEAVEFIIENNALWSPLISSLIESAESQVSLTPISTFAPGSMCPSLGDFLSLAKFDDKKFKSELKKLVNFNPINENGALDWKFANLGLKSENYLDKQGEFFVRALIGTVIFATHYRHVIADPRRIVFSSTAFSTFLAVHQNKGKVEIDMDKVSQDQLPYAQAAQQSLDIVGYNNDIPKINDVFEEVSRIITSELNSQSNNTLNFDILTEAIIPIVKFAVSHQDQYEKALIMLETDLAQNIIVIGPNPTINYDQLN